MTWTGAEVQVDNLAENAVEQRLDERSTHVLALDAEAQRVDTLVQDVECFGIGLFGIADCDVLTNVPLVVVLLVATNEGEFTRQGLRCLQIFQVFTTIERLYVKTFICSPYESLLEIGTFQVNLNLVQPLLLGWRLELGEEFFFVCHKLIKILVLLYKCNLFSYYFILQR